ncbi:MAG: radical SAM/SPASM domain-containing protein [Planctomycetota bacterium]
MIAKMLGIRIFDVEVSSRCNLRCRFCPREELPETGLMSEATFERFLEQVPLRRTDNLAFVGLGEPTLNPRLLDFIRRAKAQYPKLVTWVTSNGTRLTEDVVGPLLDAGLDLLDVSVNGIEPESYEAVMRGANFEQTLANLESTRAEIERRGNRTRLQINFVVTADGRPNVGDVQAFWRNRGISRFRLQREHNRGGTVDFSPSGRHQPHGLGGRQCQLAATMTFITWKGEVLHCSHDVGRRHPIGNIHADTWGVIQKRKQRIHRDAACRPEMCGACTDPLRHGIEAEISQAVLAEMRERVAGLWQRIEGRLRRPQKLAAGTGWPGALEQGESGKGVGEPCR